MRIVIIIFHFFPFVFRRAGHCLVTYQLLSSCGKDCSSSLVSVSRDGVLTSGGLSGTAFVLITAHEHSSFNQTLVLQVEVSHHRSCFCLDQFMSWKSMGCFGLTVVWTTCTSVALSPSLGCAVQTLSATSCQLVEFSWSCGDWTLSLQAECLTSPLIHRLSGSLQEQFMSYHTYCHWLCLANL